MYALNAFPLLCILLVKAYGINIVVNTWSGVFELATTAAYNTLISTSSVLDAIEVGGSTCEDNKCDGSVGYGNHPDTRGHTSLDAMIMDGDNMDVGSVGYIRKYRSAMSLARHVMTYSEHTLIVGEGAEKFEDMLGLLNKTSATTEDTVSAYESWIKSNCQPNYYRNLDGSESNCGPYNPATYEKLNRKNTHKTWANKENHDTIGMVALNEDGNMACGTTTNGANHKISGRIGDSPIVGAGCYVSSDVGGAAATGDGDIMMRFLPSFAAVNYMKIGINPSEACTLAMKPIIEHYPTFSGGLVCLKKDGSHGGASYNMGFTYSVMSDNLTDVEVVNVENMKL